MLEFPPKEDRYTLQLFMWETQQLCVKLLKSSSAGNGTALRISKDLYNTKDVTKEEYADALQSYQLVHDEINSEARKRFLKRRADKSALLDHESDPLRKFVNTYSLGKYNENYLFNPKRWYNNFVEVESMEVSIVQYS